MRLSNQTHNAVKVLVFCARSTDKIVTVPEIATACGITEFNVFKLVPLLVKAELLETIRGRGGGVRLNRKPADISIGAVVRATESVFQPAQDKSTSGDIDGIPDYSDMVDGAFLAFVEFLDRKSIADLTDVDQPNPADATAGTHDTSAVLQD